MESPHEIPKPGGASPLLPRAASQSWEVPGTHPLSEGRPHYNSHSPGAWPPSATPEAHPIPQTRAQARSKPSSCWAPSHTNFSPIPSCAPSLQTCRPLLLMAPLPGAPSLLAPTWKPAVSHLRRPAQHPGAPSVNTSITVTTGTYPAVSFPPMSAHPVLLPPPQKQIPNFTTPGLLTPGQPAACPPGLLWEAQPHRPTEAATTAQPGWEGARSVGGSHWQSLTIPLINLC